MNADERHLEHLVVFLRRMLATHPPADELHVVFQPRRGNDAEIYFVKIADAQDYGTEERLIELGEQLLEECQHDANNQPGRFARYYIRADVGAKSHRSRVLKLDTRDEEENDGDDVKDDVLRMMVKAVADSHRAIMTMGPGVAMAQQAQIERLLHREETHEDNHLKLVTLYEDALSRKAERDLMARRETRREKIVQRAVDGFMPLINHAIGQKLYKGKLPPALRSSPQFLALKEALRGVPEEHMTKFFTGLQPEIAMTLIASFQAILSEEDATNAPKQLPAPDRAPDGNPFH